MNAVIVHIPLKGKRKILSNSTIMTNNDLHFINEWVANNITDMHSL